MLRRARPSRMESYDELTRALAAIGLTGQMMRPDQLVVSSQEGPSDPLIRAVYLPLDGGGVRAQR